MSKQSQHCVAMSDVRRRDNAYILWAAIESECGEALRAWSAAKPSQRASAYAAYRAALEREEAAARHLAQVSIFTGAPAAVAPAAVGDSP
jgi:hypothetical protein